MSITQITEAEQRLTSMLRTCTEALKQVTAERDAERHKLTDIERECLLIGKEIQRAAGELPEGYDIEIRVERGYGGVTLERPDYTRLVFDDTVDGLSHCIRQAIDSAMKGKS